MRDGKPFDPPLPPDTTYQIPHTSSLDSASLPYFNNVAPFYGRTGTEIFEQLTMSELRLIHSGLVQKIASQSRGEHRIEADEIAQDTLVGFVSTYGTQRFDAEKELLAFPNPSLLMLFGAARHKVFDRQRDMYRQNRREQMLMSLADIDIIDDVGAAYLDHMEASTILGLLLEGQNFSDMQWSILHNLSLNTPRTAKIMAVDFGVQAEAIRTATSRLRQRLRQHASEVSVGSSSLLEVATSLNL